jgi:hypothetical protein
MNVQFIKEIIIFSSDFYLIDLVFEFLILKIKSLSFLSKFQIGLFVILPLKLIYHLSSTNCLI